MWQIVLGGFIGSLVPTAVTIYFSTKRQKQEDKMKLFEKVYERKIEMYENFSIKLNELYFATDWENEKESKKASELRKSLFKNYFDKIFFLPNALAMKISECLNLEKEKGNLDKASTIFMEVFDLMRSDLQIENLDSSVKENLELLQRENK